MDARTASIPIFPCAAIDSNFASGLSPFHLREKFRMGLFRCNPKFTETPCRIFIRPISIPHKSDFKRKPTVHHDLFTLQKQPDITLENFYLHPMFHVEQKKGAMLPRSAEDGAQLPRSHGDSMRRCNPWVLSFLKNFRRLP